ncbi:MAG: VOC family protein [[Actinobacillus] rossii]|uniref:Uncharacterized protein conserved in bacteria n=1 Tax=[Actinobacillus] rossii TaxID=123820 RepID=A0A380U3H2_9PAST|nr:VOC family protein [[Actinobacillus] rossii]MDD7426554.1 VOC family protein [[Actinobacillus] rossii]MDY3123127.1 VOC family protein [[Actinobacillus] rossii]MDY4507048.1 VOC family protein [[Actinobacillus] rossii]SUT94969.1 Uncharacterized protein conserved in bacteria [[Actinobacillus] rossii]
MIQKFHKLFQNSTALYTDFLSFEQKISELAQIMQVDISKFEIDHLAVRVNNYKDAEIWLTALTQYGRIFSDNIVNGRVIYLIELNEPLDFLGQSVSIVELPFPKAKIYLREGWEHIEFVVPFLPNEQTVDWVERIKLQFNLNQLPHLKLKVSEPKADGEQLPNPSLAVSFVDKSQNDVVIKIHPYSIRTVVLMEQIK